MYFHKSLLNKFKVNYTANLKNCFPLFLVVTYLCLNVKPVKSLYTFHSKICDLIKNKTHHIKSSHIGKLDMVIFCEITLWPLDQSYFLVKL